MGRSVRDIGLDVYTLVRQGLGSAGVAVTFFRAPPDMEQFDLLVEGGGILEHAVENGIDIVLIEGEEAAESTHVGELVEMGQDRIGRLPRERPAMARWFLSA